MKTFYHKDKLALCGPAKEVLHNLETLANLYPQDSVYTLLQKQFPTSQPIVSIVFRYVP